MKTQNLSTLTIHKMSQEQYDREKAAGRLDPNALYLTPDGEDLGNYYTKEEVDAIISEVAASGGAVSSVNGKTGAVVLAVSDLNGATVSTTELNYIKGVTGAIQTQLNGKAPTSHGTHVEYSTTAPVMDGTAATGSASTVARSDHKHPTDTSRAAAATLTSHTGNSDIHFTATERTKLSGIETGAQKNAVTSVAGKTGAVTLSASDVSAVPTSRTINNKALTANISLAASDVGAVPTSRTINKKALTGNISLGASDVGAVPTTRKVNGKALSADITLSASDVSAYTKAQIDSMEFITVADIDAICGTTIQVATASEVTF